jgi:hypothetical protein
MHICFQIITFYYTLRCSSCFGRYCVHHQEPSTTAHAASGYRVVLCWLCPPALFCCYCLSAVTTVLDTGKEFLLVCLLIQVDSVLESDFEERFTRIFKWQEAKGRRRKLYDVYVRAVGWGIVLQTGRSWVRFPMVSLEFFINLILPVVLWPWSRLSL